MPYKKYSTVHVYVSKEVDAPYRVCIQLYCGIIFLYI